MKHLSLSTMSAIRRFPFSSWLCSTRFYVLSVSFYCISFCCFLPFSVHRIPRSVVYRSFSLYVCNNYNYKLICFWFHFDYLLDYVCGLQFIRISFRFVSVYINFVYPSISSLCFAIDVPIVWNSLREWRSLYRNTYRRYVTCSAFSCISYHLSWTWTWTSDSADVSRGRYQKRVNNTAVLKDTKTECIWTLT